MTLYSDEGRLVLKGNLHTHTTASDGHLSPTGAMRVYRSMGYDFLAITDHWKQTYDDELDGLLTLGGCQLPASQDQTAGETMLPVRASRLIFGVSAYYGENPEVDIDELMQAMHEMKKDIPKKH